MKEIFPPIIGFVFALILFFLTETLKEIRKKKTLIKYLNRELRYNTLLIDQWIDDINKNIHFLKWAHPIFTFSAQFKCFRKTFIDKAFDSGIIYDLLNDNEIECIAKMITFFSEEKQSHIKGFINENKNVESVDDEGPSGNEIIKSYLESILEIVKKNQNELNAIIPLIH